MITFSKQFRNFLESIIFCNDLHAKWLNTLSFLENCGARKIAACEHPTLVKEEMLKHAAEEFRHAHYLKRQIKKISSTPMESYSLSYILGGMATLHYLRSLDVKTSQYLTEQGIAQTEIKRVAYLFVTYAIERRAEELYPIYDALLKEVDSPIAVKSILLEEKEHLKEMEDGIEKIPLGWKYANHICAIESALCKKWLENVMSYTLV